MAFSRVEAALDSIGLRAKYLQGFRDDDMDDDAVDECLADPGLAMNLNGIIPSGGHRLKFQKAFKKIPLGSSSLQNNTISSSSSVCKEEVIDPNVPQPVQIMDFKESKKRGSPSEIVFHQNRLQEILNKTKSKKVAVLAIAGPSRKGKSFFLNFVLRYLNSLETGDKDWMGWRQPKKGLDGFTWRNSVERVTTGIWMWSEPFTMKSKSDDFDLLIMDTQGVFDEHTTQREWSILVGLGLLTSSCLIFNIMSDLQEDYLQVFENFLEFGLMAMNEKNGRTPFQKLVFLIRDWNIPGGHPYGSSGGKKFIAKKLDVKSHHKESHRRVRRQLKECFEEIACFLLPHPGQSVLATDFDGSTTATKSEAFAVEIEKSIMELTNPSKIPLKKLNGNFLTGQDILSIFQLYCELFNSDEIPNPESVFEITAKSCNTLVIKKCVDAFSKELLAQLDKRPFFLDADLEKERCRAQDTCCETFEQSRKMGDKNMILQAREELLEQIEASFQAVKTKNTQKYEKVISQVTADSIKEFQQQVQQHLQNAFVSTHKLESIFQKCENEILNTFLTSCGIRDQLVFQEHVGTLLEAQKSAFRDKNLLKKGKAENELRGHIKEMVVNYHESFDSQTENRIVSEEELEEIHKSEMKRARLKFEGLELQEELIEDGEEILRKTIQEEFSRIKKSALEFNQLAQLQGKSFVSEAIAKYKDKMEAKLTFNKSEFQEYHEEALKSCQEFLSSSFRVDAAELLGELQDELDDMVSKAYDEYLLSLTGKEDILKSKLDLAKHDAINEYSVSMQNLFPDDNAPVEQSYLERTHEEAKSKALEFVKNCFEKATAECPGADEEWLKKVTAELEADVDQKHETLISFNQERKYNEDAKALEGFLTEVKEHYTEKMSEALDEITDEDELKDLACTMRQESIDKFMEQAETMVLKPEVLDKFLLDLKASIDREFEDSLKLFRYKKAEDEMAVKTALLNARDYYDEEMGKHFHAKDWLEVEELQSLHTELEEAAVVRGKQERDLTSSEENQLRELILIKYKVYEDKNILRIPRDSYAIGIDLGTTYSCVAVCIKGNVKVIPCGNNTTIPSYVAFNDDADHSISVGEAAKDQSFRCKGRSELPLPSTTYFVHTHTNDH